MSLLQCALVQYNDAWEINVWNCIICSQPCESINTFKTHLQEHQDLDNITLTLRISALDEHPNAFASRINIECQQVLSEDPGPEDEGVCESPESLKGAHMECNNGSEMDMKVRSHKVQTPHRYECPNCDFETSLHDNYHRHMLTHVRTFNCEHCARTIDSNSGRTGCRQKASFNFNQGRKKRSAPGLRREECDLTTNSHHNFHGHVTLQHQHPVTRSRSEKLLTPTRKKIKRSIKQERNADEEKDSSLYTCVYCEWSTRRHFNYHRHLSLHSATNDGITCVYCDKQLTPKPAAHITIKEDAAAVVQKEKAVSPAGYICEKCGYTCLRKDHLHIHEIQHLAEDERVLHACSECDYKTWLASSLRSHESRAHRALACPLCPRAVPMPYPRLLDHLSSHHGGLGGRRRLCGTCGWVARDDDELSTHAATVHSPTHVLFACHLCHFAGAEKETLKAHIAASHTPHDLEQFIDDTSESSKQLPLKCPLCDRSFSQQALLTRHRFEHFKTFYCVACRQDFEDLVGFNVHLEETHGRIVDGALQCKLCGECFPSRDLLKKHQLLESLFLCTVCDQTFPRRWNLKRHYKESHSESEQVCEVCGFISKSVARMSNHYLKVHHTSPPAHITEWMKDNYQKKKRYSTTPSKKYKVPKEMCDICGKTVTKYALKNHLALHKDQENQQSNPHHVQSVQDSTVNTLQSSAQNSDLPIQVVKEPETAEETEPTLESEGCKMEAIIHQDPATQQEVKLLSQEMILEAIPLEDASVISVFNYDNMDGFLVSYEEGISE